MTFDADWFGTDFFVSRVADEPQTSTQFWGLIVNGKFSDVGGCR